MGRYLPRHAHPGLHPARHRPRDSDRPRHRDRLPRADAGREDTMTEVRFGRDEQGAVTVLVPEGYEPLDQLLYDDLHGNRQALAEILDHARNPTQEWGTGGNSCWITITPNTVTID